MGIILILKMLFVTIDTAKVYKPNAILKQKSPEK